MERPNMPEDLLEVKRKREAAVKIEMGRSVRTKLLVEIFAVGPIGDIDLALGVDRKSILKEVLLELAGTLDEYVAEYPENMH